MKENKSDDLIDLASKVAEESGVSVDKLLGDLEKNIQRVAKMCKSDAGKYKILGIDKFSGEDWLHGEYGTAEEALEEARKLTKEGMGYATHSDIATVYYAYDSDGKYLGGDTWHGE